MSDSFSTPWTIALQTPLSMGFPRQEYWSGLPFPTPGDLSQPRDPTHVPCIAGGFFTTEPQGNPSPQLIFVGLINVWLDKWVNSEKEVTSASGCGNADKGQRQEHMVWWPLMCIKHFITHKMSSRATVSFDPYHQLFFLTLCSKQGCYNSCFMMRRTEVQWFVQCFTATKDELGLEPVVFIQSLVQ